jgi:hypothetical protein
MIAVIALAIVTAGRLPRRLSRSDTGGEEPLAAPVDAVLTGV